MNAVERMLVIQALREAASVTRVDARKKAYLELAKKLKGEADAEVQGGDVPR
jgi:hypothetical protein